MALSDPQNARGQNHERLLLEQQQHEGGETLPYTPPVAVDDDDNTSLAAINTGMREPPEITVSQRMMSATAGSLLTGLLVTPLDVVRVRLQSQRVSHPVIDFEKLPANFAKIARSTDLGVSACCREVFFMHANTEVCVAGPKGAAAAAAAVAEGGEATTPAQASARARAMAAARATALSDCAVQQNQQKTFNSTMDGLRKIARNEGIFTLWRGLSPTLLMSIPANVIYFTGYEWLRYNPKSPITRVTPDAWAPLAAGAFARVLAAASVGPVELFRTRLQATQGDSVAGPLRDTFQGLRAMVAAHGYRALWRGLTLTLWRDVPFSGMYWWGYEATRAQLTEARTRRRARDAMPLDLDGSHRTRERERGRGTSRSLERRRSQSHENHRDTFLDSFLAGSLSGAAASIATMPFDVGKTRTQVFREARPGGGSRASTATAGQALPEEQNMARLLWYIFRTEGMGGLFRGWIPRTLKVAPACAIMISSYEVGKKVFSGMNERALQRQQAGV